MPNERIPKDPDRSGFSEDEFSHSSRYDRDLPPLDRGFDRPVPSSGKVALFAIAVVLLLGAVFYGLSNTKTHEAANPPPRQTTQSERTSPQAPSGMRDLTPRPNTQPGTTTGAAPSQTTPPSTAPSTMNKPSGEVPNQ